VSDAVKEMTTVVPLGIGESFVSGGVYLGGYSSLSVVGFAGRKLTISVEYSGDNVNWDAVETKGVAEQSSVNITFPIHSKWVRMTVTNTSGLNMSELRVFTYGVVEGGGAGSGGGGGSLPMTLTAALEAGEFTPEIQYLLDRSSFGGGDTDSPDGIITEYKDLQTWSSTGTVDYSGAGSNGLKITGFTSPSLKSSIWGRTIHCKPGQPMRSVFTGSFQQGSRGEGGEGALLQYLGIGLWSEEGNTFNPTTWLSFIGFGFSRETHPQPVTNADFGIFYGADNNFITVLQADWNIDKADGKGSLPSMGGWLFGGSNTFKIDYLLEGRIVFSLMSTSDGCFYPVHQVVRGFSIFQNSFSVAAYYENPTGVIVQGTASVGLTSAMLGFLGTRVEDRYTTYVDETPIESGSYGAERTIVNYQLNRYFENTNIQYTSDVVLTSLGMVFNGSGSQVNGIIRLYRNLPIGGVPAYSKEQAYNVHIPMDKDVTGTFTAYPPVGYTYPKLTQAAQLLFAPINELETQRIDLTPYHLLLKSGDTLTITYTGGTASVGGILSLGFKAFR